MLGKTAHAYHFFFFWRTPAHGKVWPCMTNISDNTHRILAVSSGHFGCKKYMSSSFLNILVVLSETARWLDEGFGYKSMICFE